MFPPNVIAETKQIVRYNMHAYDPNEQVHVLKEVRPPVEISFKFRCTRDIQRAVSFSACELLLDTPKIHDLDEDPLHSQMPLASCGMAGFFVLEPPRKRKPMIV
jgi:hypothetical protein